MLYSPVDPECDDQTVDPECNADAWAALGSGEHAGQQRKTHGHEVTMTSSLRIRAELGHVKEEISTNNIDVRMTNTDRQS